MVFQLTMFHVLRVEMVINVPWFINQTLATPGLMANCQCCCLFVAEKIIHVAVKCWPCCLKDLMLQISLVMISRVADRSQEPVYTGKSSCCSSRIIPNIMLTKSSGSYNEDTERNLKFTSEDQVRGGLLGIIVNRLKSGSYRVKSGRHNSVPRSLFWREDPNRDGERGFDYLTSALVLSKVHREGCRASCGEFPYAYGGKPTVNLLRSFLNLGRVGDWLTLSNRGCANVPIALVKPITHLANWKGNFFYVENRIIPSDYLELLLESNKFDKKSFGDKAGLKNSWKHIPKEPVIYYWGHGIYSFIDGEFKFLSEGCIDDNQGSPSSKSINNEAPVIDAKPLTSLHPPNFIEDVVDSDDASAEDNKKALLSTSLPPLPKAWKQLRSLGKSKLPSGVRDSLLKVQKMVAQASKVAGEASDPLDVDIDADIHGMLLLSFKVGVH
ncbi:hypothetical protein Tco_0730904 [Tanacetum coccineum]